MEFLTTSKINFQSLKLNAISFDGSFDSRVYCSILKNTFKETERFHHRLDSLKTFLEYNVNAFAMVLFTNRRRKEYKKKLLS